jgi:hypothetical protein
MKLKKLPNSQIELLNRLMDYENVVRENTELKFNLNETKCKKY